MKKLLFINTDMCAGGIEVSLINLLKNIDYSNYEVSLLLLTQNLEFLNRIPDNCEIIKVSRNDLEYKGSKLYRYIQNLYSKKRNIVEKLLLKMIRPLEEILFKTYISNKMKNKEYDVAISYRIGIVADVTLKSIKAKKKIVFYHHGKVHHFPGDKKWYTKFDNIVTVSNGIKAELSQHYPYAKGKISVIHNLLDIEYIRKCGESLYVSNKPDNYITIVSVGRLVKDKGFDMLIIACCKLKQMGYNIRLIIVGGSDLTRYDKVLSKIVCDCGMAENVIWTGSQGNPYSVMKCADIYVQPSYVEAFGITIREAQILGLPILSTNTYGAKEIVEENITGVLCDISVDGILDGIKLLIDNEEIRNKLSQNCLTVNYQKENLDQLKKLYELI